MVLIAGLMDNKTTHFSSIIDKFISQIEDPEQTLSAILLNKILDEKIDFLELGRTIGNDYKNYYISLETSKNSDWSLLEKESVDSKKRQLELEQPDHQSFEGFVKEYFNESSCTT
jgi:gamma-glutamylcysteine synthetase